LNLHDSAVQLGGLRAIELASFERLGARAVRDGDDAEARWCASASLAHAWRAGLLEDLLPVSAGLPSADDLTVLPAGPLAEALDRALPAVPPGADDTADRVLQAGGSQPDGGCALVADLVEGLYPALSAVYEHRIATAGAAADGPLVRTLTRVSSDLREVTARGAMLVEAWRG